MLYFLVANTVKIMKSDIKIYICSDSGEKFFGQGPYELLKNIDKLGSLRKAAIEMNMAYTKALQLINKAEKELGFKLCEKSIGGKGGGGSVLSNEAREFMNKYEKYADECRRSSQEIYNRYFQQQ